MHESKAIWYKQKPDEIKLKTQAKNMLQRYISKKKISFLK